MTSDYTDLQIIYPVVHNESRFDKVKSRKQKQVNYRGYDGSRYMTTMKSDLKYWTMRSVYMRHREMTRKYEYDFDPKGSFALQNLQRRWNQKLYKYLSMFGSGQFVKSRSSRDKQKFKEENGFALKKNPLVRMMEIFDKLNYLSVVQKIFRPSQAPLEKAIESSQSGNNPFLDDQECKTGQQNQSESGSEYTQADSRSTNYTEFMEELQQGPESTECRVKKAKILRMFDSYKGKGYLGRKEYNLYQKHINKIKLNTKKRSRQLITNKTLEKDGYKQIFKEIALYY